MRIACQGGMLLVGIVVFASTIVHAQPAPNILVLLVDDLGWTDTSVQIDPNEPNSKSDFYQTPRLEQLASQGMTFSNGYASSPVCGSTRAAIQTGKTSAAVGRGLTPEDHRFMRNPQDGVAGSITRENLANKPMIPPLVLTELPQDEITVAEHIKANAPQYRTSHHHKWGVSLKTGNNMFNSIRDQGYDVADAGWVVNLPNDPMFNASIAQSVNTFMEDSVNLGQPFYSQVSWATVHTPYNVHQTTLDKYTALPPGTRHTSPIYAAMVEEMDTAIGLVLDKIDELGIADNTYVIFTSDNGGLTGPSSATENAPLLGGKSMTYEGGLRVPWIVRGPGIAGGTYSDVPIVTHDILSTAADMAGITAPDPNGVEGTSILPILEGTATSLSRVHGPNGELFWHFPFHKNGGLLNGGQLPSSAIRDGKYKLLRHYEPDGNTLMLFDLEANLTESPDPNSSLNLADVLPSVRDSLENKLDAWLLAIDAPMPEIADADFNNDLVTNGIDFLIWQRNINFTPATHFQGDANGDAFVNSIDLSKWEESYGISASVLSEAVPEPSTICLTGVALLLLRIPRKRL